MMGLDMILRISASESSGASATAAAMVDIDPPNPTLKASGRRVRIRPCEASRPSGWPCLVWRRRARGQWMDNSESAENELGRLFAASRAMPFQGERFSPQTTDLGGF
jgi:hypothetical protein